MTYTVRIATVGRSKLMHIEGLANVRDYGPNAGSDTLADGSQRGWVTYAPSSACSTLSSASALYKTYVATTDFVRNEETGRGRHVRSVREFELSEVRSYVESVKGKLCSNCARALAAQLSD